MKVLLTTTGTQSSIPLPDLGGRVISHPTISFDITSEYSIDEIENSQDLQDALTAGYITLVDDSAQSITNLSTDLEGVKEITSNVEQWNADRIESVHVNDSGKGNGKVLIYNSSTQQFDYGDSSAIGGIDPLWALIAEPTGFVNRTDSEIIFNPGTRTFSVAPTGVSFDIYIGGQIYTFSSSQDKQIDDTEGVWYIYFNNSGVISASQTVWNFENNAPIAIVYWDATLNQLVFMADERHGIVMDWKTHNYLHKTRGAWLSDGIVAGDYYTDGDGTLDSDAQISFTNGILYDEDIVMNIVHSNTPSADFEQILTPISQIPVYYRTGSESNPAWKKDTATNFPVKQGTSRIQWNKLDSGTWSVEDIPHDGGFVPMWIVATNIPAEPIIAILGDTHHESLSNALATAILNVDDTFPFKEFRGVYRLIFKSLSTYTNTPVALLKHVLRIAPSNKQVDSVDIALNKLTGAYTNSSFFNTSTKDDKIEVSDSSYQVVASLIYDGSSVSAIEIFRIVASRAGTLGTAYVRLWDLTNSQEICVISFTDEPKQLYRTIDMQNLPEGEATIEIQMYTSGSKSAIHSYKIV